MVVMLGTRKVLFHGDPCRGSGCSRLAVGRQAENYGRFCRLCWLASTETERRMAIFMDESTTSTELQYLWAASLLRPAEQAMTLERLLLKM